MSEPAKRRRKPQQDVKAWPPVHPEKIEEAIDSLCGCAGRHDCDCVSVFNRARGQMWWDYNTHGGLKS